MHNGPFVLYIHHKKQLFDEKLCYWKGMHKTIVNMLTVQLTDENKSVRYFGEQKRMIKELKSV